MWNVIAAQVIDHGDGTIFLSTVYNFLEGDLIITSDEDRAMKIILYQCSAQAHFYAHLAFNSVAHKKTITGKEWSAMMQDPSAAIRKAKHSSPSLSEALLQRNVESDVRYLVRNQSTPTYQIVHCSRLSVEYVITSEHICVPASLALIL